VQLSATSDSIINNYNIKFSKLMRKQ